MSLLAAMAVAQTGEGRIQGVVIGVVTNTDDPDKQGRVRLSFPWLSDADESAWARIAVPMAGAGTGVCFPLAVHDEVLVAFEHGDPRFPFVLGALWNGRDAPPSTNRRVAEIHSRSGHVIRLTDEDGQEKIEIIDKSGEASLVLESAGVTLKGAAITIEASGALTLKGATVDIN